MTDDSTRVDTTGEVTSSRTASTAVPCQNCGREKDKHVRVADAGVNEGAADYPVLICPSRVYEPERHP